jgi:hypothetical protein
MRKKYINLAISGVSLLPTSIILENSDNLEVINSLPKAIENWMAGLVISTFIAGLFWGITRLFNFRISFISVLTYTIYGMALLILLILFVLPLL